MKESVAQKADNNGGVIQIHELKNSLVYQVVNGIKAPEDLDQAILATHEHIDKLQMYKGWRDLHIFLAIPAAGLITYAVMVRSMAALPCATLGFVMIYLGYRVNKYITRINIELDAARIVLTELYKHKVSRQVGAGLQE